MSKIYSYSRSDVPNLTDKEIKRIYNKRRKVLQTGHCVRCLEKLTPTYMNCKWFPERKGELVATGGIRKDNKCPKCETDLMEFCFQDLFDEAKAKAKEIILEAKAQKKANKNS